MAPTRRSLHPIIVFFTISPSGPGFPFQHEQFHRSLTIFTCHVFMIDLFSYIFNIHNPHHPILGWLTMLIQNPPTLINQLRAWVDRRTSGASLDIQVVLLALSSPTSSIKSWLFTDLYYFDRIRSSWRLLKHFFVSISFAIRPPRLHFSQGEFSRSLSIFAHLYPQDIFFAGSDIRGRWQCCWYGIHSR